MSTTAAPVGRPGEYRTAALDRLAQQVLPAEAFELSSDDARDWYFADTSREEAGQLVHHRYRTNPLALHDHLVAAMALRGTEELLDLGCGNGVLLEHLRPHLAGGHIVGLDISPAMLNAARARLLGVATPCEFVLGDAQDLSTFGDNSFDRVCATYMAHYVSDLQRLFSEVRRVLRPGGRFVLATDDPATLVEMWDVHFAAMTEMHAPAHLFRSTPKARISLVNGPAQVAAHFAQVRVERWQDQLQFSDPAPFLAFYRSHNYCCAASRPGQGLPAHFFAELEERVVAKVQAVIDERDYFALTKLTGALVCS
ncbi:class I SAM-dependent methyltransferase [Streptacidiphilus sp. MAP5-52]|uniref:class I SAM-dependent methyltransferase n=1 Tax=Streptacidiphilus sp. MAP5-52 TaxID=3156267 RepID=UPI003514A574